MWETLERLFAGQFMPHGHCYLWSPEMVWLQVVSNLLIGLAYVSISSTLYVIIRRIKDVPFSWMFIAFGVFIITCGGTHFLDVVTVWHPVYWLDGGLRAITAFASVGTALLLFPLVPRAITLAGAAQVAHERGEKLESTYRELATAHEKAKELERLKSEFFASVSHELRTPLALVLGPAARLLAGSSLTSDQRRDLELVNRNARIVLKHVNDLLDLAKLEVGKMTLDYARVDLAEVVRNCASSFDGLAAERSMQVVFDLPAEVMAEVDTDKVQRVVLNLFSNAFKFTPVGGTVRSTISVKGDRAIIEVADSGPGVAADMRERVFERFAQADASATRRFGGTGLGLAIAKELITLHGGTVSIGEAAEGGASLVVDLPLRAPEGSPVRETASPEELPDAVGIALATRKSIDFRTSEVATNVDGDAARAMVLVVEDDREMNTYVSEILATNYRVERAYDGEEGLAKARALVPDAIVTDVMMPRKSGEELVRAVRTQAELADVPVVVLTAKADDELRSRVLRSGAQDYLVKPFLADELLARVGNLVTMAMLRVARDRAAEASKLKTGFLGLVSHELRTPLTTIQLLVDRLSESEEQPAREKQLVERVGLATARLTDLVDTLLHYARIQSGHLAPNVEPFDLVVVVTEAVEELRPQAHGKSLVLSVNTPTEAVQVESDPVLVRLVVVNLVTNALKFTDKGSVTVAVESQGDRRIIRVVDTGQGIAAEEQKRIFEPFQRLEPTRHKHLPGVGLGLSLVRQITDSLGGEVVVRSELGKGSTFEVSLPAVRAR